MYLVAAATLFRDANACLLAPPPHPVLQLHAVAAAVGRALLEHQRRLTRSAGPEATLFASRSLDAVEAKLASVKQQASSPLSCAARHSVFQCWQRCLLAKCPISPLPAPCPTPTPTHNNTSSSTGRPSLRLQIALVRALKEQHIAERQVVLKAALQDDLDADLKQAAELPPLPGAGSGGAPIPAPGLPAPLPAHMFARSPGCLPALLPCLMLQSPPAFHPASCCLPVQLTSCRRRWMP